MEFLSDPSIWVGLITLIVLEIVLGIDNLVFIAILADKLPPHQRDKARILGLSLALLMRIGLLFAISWLVTLTQPLVTILGGTFSGRDLILLIGGLFLVFKATTELHERLEGHAEHNGPRGAFSSFWLVVLQIIVLDAVFSLDSVITAVGMVNHIGVMISAMVIAMAVMMLASKPLTNFVNQHPTVVVLCISFLLMIGFSLIADGFGFHIPKGYLYAAIGFSVLIEFFNQVAIRNRSKQEARLPMRQRTADAILRLLGDSQVQDAQHEAHTKKEEASDAPKNTSNTRKEESFAAEERFMITGVLSLAERSIRTIMTPRGDISWVDCEGSVEEIHKQLLATPHSMFPVCKDSLDDIIGVVPAKEILNVLKEGNSLEEYAKAYAPIMIPDRVDVLRSLNVLRNAHGSLVVVVDEYGTIQGLLTPLDVLEAIAGEFPDADEVPEITRDGDIVYAHGAANLHQLEIALGGEVVLTDYDDIATLSGFLLNLFEQIPVMGDALTVGHYRFEITEMDDHRIEMVKITKLDEDFGNS